jgi:redox-sensing transcriptional repressor
VSRKVSESTVRRLSYYLRILEQMERSKAETVSSEDLAAEAGTTAAQVRKDLSLFGSFGKRGLGYGVAALADHLRAILGLGRTWRVLLAGAGRIGAALFEYPDFRRRGFEIACVVDSDPAKVGLRWGGVTITDAERLEDEVRRFEIEVMILAVPAEAAQALALRAVDAGVRGILNFAPTQLRVPAQVAVQDVNMVMELEALSFELTQSDAG